MTTENRLKGLPRDINGDDLKRLTLGITNTEVVDTSSADAIPAMDNCRAVSVDVDGVMKFDYIDDAGENTTTEVKTMKAGVIYPYRRVSKVYRYYTGTTAVTQVYASTGSLVNGLKLHR